MIVNSICKKSFVLRIAFSYIYCYTFGIEYEVIKMDMLKNEEIGSRLKSLREKRNFTLEQVGEAIGVSKATVQRYETGEIDIKRNTALKLSDVYRVSPAYVMGWTDQKTEELTPDKQHALKKILELEGDQFDEAIRYAEYLANQHKRSKD